MLNMIKAGYAPQVMAKRRRIPAAGKVHEFVKVYSILIVPRAY